VAYILPNWPAPPHIKAFSSTRIGGESDNVYCSMNLGMHVGDDELRVIANRKKLKSDLNLIHEPAWLEQVHSTNIVSADAAISSAADGAYSKNKQTACIVMTADCLPLLLSNVAGDQVAAIHVGWRGMANGIIEKAVALFDCPPSEILAWAGPCIGPSKFEIGDEVKALLGGPDSAYKFIKNNKLLANLYALCGARLAALGVLDYSHSEACTYSDDERFFSYRRDGQCGRMATIIWIDRNS